MEQVSLNRGWPIVGCMVSSPFAPLGEWVTVTSQLNGLSRQCRVTDEPQAYHRQGQIERGLVVELDFETAKALCQISRYGQEPPSACPVTLIRSR